jgi:hypothetical protein
MLGKVSPKGHSKYLLRPRKFANKRRCTPLLRSRPLHAKQTRSITDERLDFSDKNGIGYPTVSLTIPDIQGVHEKDTAEM